MTTDPRHRAWDDIHDLLPAGWPVGPTSFDPGVGGWSVTARGPKAGGRLKPPPTITGQGEDELVALTDLVLKLRELDRADHMAALERRARLAYYQGAQDAALQARCGRCRSRCRSGSSTATQPSRRGQTSTLDWNSDFS